MSLGIVETKYGKLQGVTSDRPGADGVTYFKGIRYGADCSGPNRWKAPMDPPSWEGIKVCDTYGPAAYQPSRGGLGNEPYASYFYYEGNPDCSEDCLFLNVTTAAQNPGEKRPVYMWFHGGGLGGGFSFEPPFDGTTLAQKGVIVVTVGHRLNVFGYLALPQLSKEQGGVSGNYGLMDEVKALDWIYENIEAFGGDPENITVGGQSGGTAKSGALAGSPMQKGRVKRVINESNLNWIGRDHLTVPQAEQIGINLLISKGIDPNISLDELRALPPGAFFGTGLTPVDMAVGAMCADGKYIMHTSQAQNIDEYANHCDYISGGNFGESSIRPGIHLGAAAPVSQEEFYEAARAQLGDLYDKYDFPNNFPCDPDNADRISRRYAAMGITNYGGLIINRYFGDYRKRHGHTGNTYSYLFSRVPPCHPEEMGTSRDSERLLAWHSSEIWYAFGSLYKSADGNNNIPPIRPWTDTDVRLADQMSSYWANFIKTGDPNGEGLPHWPKSDDTYGWIELGDTIEGHKGKESPLDQMLYEFLMRKENLPQ